MTIEEFSDMWRAPDGWPVRRASIPPRTAARGSLLFLAGRGDHMEKYAETMRHWAGQGWRVDSFDWRGQGGSGRFARDATVGHVEDFRCWIDDLQAYCAQWRSSHPGPHVVVAHSMGGHLALHALAQQRMRVDAAVLVAPMLGIAAGGIPRPLAAALAGFACSLGHAERSLWRSRRTTPQLMSAMRAVLTHSPERFEEEARLRRERPDLVLDAPSWGWMRAAYRSIALLERPGYLERVTTPILILATKGDRLVSAPAIARTVRRLPHARVHFYGRDVAHEILREVDSVRDDALARIADFLDDHARARRQAKRTGLQG